MATRTAQHGASASRRRTGSGARSSRARSANTSRSTSSTRRPTTSKRRPAESRGSYRGYLLPLFIVLLVVAAAWTFYPVARIQYAEEREAARLEAELEGLQERNVDLRAQVDRLKTPEGVEEIARESLGMVKAGENLVVLVEEDKKESPSVPDPNTACIPEPEPTVWGQVLDAIFGLE